MKNLAIVTSVFLISTSVFASGTDPIYQNTAEKIVKEIYGRKGDTVHSTKISAEYINDLEIEQFEVTLSNRRGSVVYKTDIKVSDDSSEIKIVYLEGN